MWRASLLGLVTVALLIIACGGGGGGSVKYAPTVVPIKHLDLSSVALSYKEFRSPPGADQYPAIVVTVNDTPVSGTELARQEVVVEWSKRSRAGLPDFALAQLPPEGVAPRDALEAAIDEQLKQQAIQRLGLLPSHDQAVQYTRDQEATTEKSLAIATPEQRATTIAMLQDEGFPASDWASSDLVVSFYAQMMAVIQLGHTCHNYNAHTPDPTLGFANLIIASSCAGFLANERKSAQIVYYVRWAD